MLKKSLKQGTLLSKLVSPGLLAAVVVAVPVQVLLTGLLITPGAANAHVLTSTHGLGATTIGSSITGSTAGWAMVSDSENRGIVELNEAGDGVVISAHTAGTPSGRVTSEICTVYEPVLVFDNSDVVREDVKPESDFSALVTRGEGDSEELKVRRACRPRGATESGTGNLDVTVRLYQESHWVSLKQLVGELARAAIDAILFPATKARFAPPARTRTLVGVDTWFWVPATSWKPIVKVVGVPPVVVTAVASPIALRFSPGDGSATVSCPGPGLPWVPGGRTLCSHVYQEASTLRTTGRYNGVITVVWMVRWFSTTGASGVIGPIQMPQINSVKVVEAQAVLHA